MTTEIAALHQLYCQLTSQAGMPCRFDRVRQWHDWMQCGWGEKDLRIVVRYLRSMINERKRNEGALKFSNLIAQVDRFEEDLYEARRVLNIRPDPVPVTVTQASSQTDGGTVNRLDTRVPKSEPVHVGGLTREYMDEMKRKAGLIK